MPTIRVLLFIHARNEVRYSDLARRINSRGTLSLALKELEEEKLVSRRVVTARPIQSFYALSEKGKRVAELFEEIASLGFSGREA